MPSTRRPSALAAGLTLACTLAAVGCSEEAPQAVNPAAPANPDAAAVDADTQAVEESLSEQTSQVAEQASAQAAAVVDQAQETLADVQAQAQATAQQAQDTAEAKADEVQAMAADRLAALKTQATDMLAKIQTLIEEAKFEDAQSLLNQLTDMAGIEQLDIQPQIDTLQEIITQGKGVKDLTDNIGSLLGN